MNQMFLIYANDAVLPAWDTEFRKLKKWQLTDMRTMSLHGLFLSVLHAHKNWGLANMGMKS